MYGGLLSLGEGDPIRHQHTTSVTTITDIEGEMRRKRETGAENEEGGSTGGVALSAFVVFYFVFAPSVCLFLLFVFFMSVASAG